MKIKSVFQSNNKAWVWQVGAIAVVLTIVSITLDLQKEGSQAITKSSSPSVQIDTLIPSDHTLIPIEVLNYESVNAVLGLHGVVDIYSPGESQPLATNVKITRAPRDPDQLSLLVPARESPRIVRAQGPFKVVIRNPHSTGTNFVKQKTFSQRRILIGQD